MGKEIEIMGCMEIPDTMSQDEFIDQFLETIESKGWFFGGGFREIKNSDSLLTEQKKQ